MNQTIFSPIDKCSFVPLNDSPKNSFAMTFGLSFRLPADFCSSSVRISFCKHKRVGGSVFLRSPVLLFLLVICLITNNRVRETRCYQKRGKKSTSREPTSDGDETTLFFQDGTTPFNSFFFRSS